MSAQEADLHAHGSTELNAPDASPEAPAEAAPGGKESQSPSPTVYDSEAQQRIPVELLVDGERYDVTLVADPVRDPTLTTYAQKCEQASAVESAEEDSDAAPQFAAAVGAVAWLFDAVMRDVEGIGEEGEEKPADWREIFGPQDKAAIVDRAFFGIDVIPPPAAKKGKRPKWGDSLRSVTTRLRVPFNGRLIEVSHTLRKADAARLGEFTALYARTLSMARGGDANMTKFAEGYDALHVAHANYKGAVPQHHKAIAYIAHMRQQGAAVRKN